MLARALRPTSTKLILATSTTLLLSSYISPSFRTSLLSLPAVVLGSQSSRALHSSTTMAQDYPKGKSDQEWQAQLSPEQFRILRKKGTEAAGTGEYDGHYPGKGVYECAGCGTPLYTADTKFKSGCGWPAFFDSIPGAVTQHTDSSFGMQRTEIVCTACGGHLGHLFKNEGFANPTPDRACVNSVSIRFNEAGEGKWEGKK